MADLKEKRSGRFDHGLREGTPWAGEPSRQRD